MDIISYILSKRYCDNAIVGLGAIRGANCTIDNIVHQDGINTVTFKWTGTDGTTKTRDMVVYDGTPIYVWESGNTYHYGDLAIYESQFYRCIVENNDVTFDSTKWNEIGSPDGNYDIVQSVNLLPARFTAADRKLYYVIDENCFYLWNGTAWVKTISNKIADLDDVNLDDLTEGDVLVWDSVNEKWVNKAKFDEYKTAFTGTQAQWNALTPAQQNVYEIINITDDGEVINLGVYLEKKATLPTANADNLGKIYIYTGASNANYKKGACYECQQVGQNYTWVQVSVSKDDFNALGTASTKNYTSNVRPNNTDLVESQAVYSAINNALSSIYVPRGELSCAELTTDLLIPANVGNVYTMSDSGTTSALFINGAGHPIAVNDNVGIIKAGEDSIMFNLMGNAFDLHDYQTKELETPITIDGTQETEVESALGGLNGAVDKRVTYEYNGKVGAKNLLVYPYGVQSKEEYGVTFTVNNDGSVSVTGTSTNAMVFDLYNNQTSKKFILPAGTYICSGNVDINLWGQIIVRDSLDNWSTVATVPMDGVSELVITDEMAEKIATQEYVIWVRIECRTNATFDNVVYPMIRYASDTDPTWQPYAKTNYELTQDVNNLPIRSGTGNNSAIIGDSNNTATSAYGFAGGSGSTSTGNSAVAIGVGTRAVGTASYAEGNQTQARGQYSHAEGTNAIANGIASHAEGYHTSSTGNYSHAQGMQVSSNGMSQTVIGKYNILQGQADSISPTDKALIIGNGEANARSNALAVQWDGTVVMQDNSTIKSAKTVYEVMGKMGAKNLNSFPYYMDSQTINGVTFTVNSDGSVTANGTTNAENTLFVMHSSVYMTNSLTLPSGKYILSGCPNSSVSDYYLRITYGGTSGQVIDSGQGATFTRNEDTVIGLVICIPHDNYTIDNVTFYPMLRYADDQDNTYQPYAMTNKELTDKLNNMVEFTSQELQAMW